MTIINAKGSETYPSVIDAIDKIDGKSLILSVGISLFYKNSLLLIIILIIFDCGNIFRLLE